MPGYSHARADCAAAFSKCVPWPSGRFPCVPERLGLILVSFRGSQPRSIRAVLAYLIDQHPAQPTIPALSEALSASCGDSEEEGAVECAVRELNRVGLIDCRNGRAVPTQAAIYFARLEED